MRDPSFRFARTSLTACIAASHLSLACSSEPAPAPASPEHTQGTLTLSAPVEHVERMPAREPMMAEHPNGTLFVTGYGAPAPNLWKSTDQGTTWTTVNVGTEAQGAIGNSDVELAMAPDGTLYFIAMSYNRKTYEGTGIAVGATRDAGATWTWTQLSKTRYDDRPWVEVTSNNTAHAVWNDGSGVSYARSTDGGRTWQEQPRIHPQGHSSHLAVGPAGEIAVRITPVSASFNVQHAGVDLIAVSADGGSTWMKHAAPGTRAFTFPYSEAEDPMPRWVEPIAWDAAGHLYYLWTDPAAQRLARMGLEYEAGGAAQARHGRRVRARHVHEGWPSRGRHDDPGPARPRWFCLAHGFTRALSLAVWCRPRNSGARLASISAQRRDGETQHIQA